MWHTWWCLSVECGAQGRTNQHCSFASRIVSLPSQSPDTAFEYSFVFQQLAGKKNFRICAHVRILIHILVQKLQPRRVAVVMFSCEWFWLKKVFSLLRSYESVWKTTSKRNIGFDDILSEKKKTQQKLWNETQPCSLCMLCFRLSAAVSQDDRIIPWSLVRVVTVVAVGGPPTPPDPRPSPQP